MKIFLVLLSSSTVYCIHIKYKNTYQQQEDSFWTSLLIIPSAVLAFIINHEFSFMELLLTFSIHLEALAIIPQLYMIQKLPFQCPSKEKRVEEAEDQQDLVQYVPIEMLRYEDISEENARIENIRRATMFSALACTDFFYIFNWIYRYNSEGFYDIIAFVSGCIQTMIYLRFLVFYIFLSKMRKIDL